MREKFDDPLRQCPGSSQRKTLLRKAVMESLSAMTPEVRRTKSQLIVRHLLELDVFKSAAVVMAYVAMEMEVDPWGLIREAWGFGKRVAMPRIDPPLAEARVPENHNHHLRAFELRHADVDDPEEHGDLRPDVMGILEPKPSAPEMPHAEIDVILVPCVAYDRRGARLGKGGGFYDRFLAQDDLDCTSVGLAFSEQLFANLPRCPHDRPVDYVVTEAGIITAQQG